MLAFLLILKKGKWVEKKKQNLIKICVKIDNCKKKRIATISVKYLFFISIFNVTIYDFCSKLTHFIIDIEGLEGYWYTFNIFRLSTYLQLVQRCIV